MAWSHAEDRRVVLWLAHCESVIWPGLKKKIVFQLFMCLRPELSGINDCFGWVLFGFHLDMLSKNPVLRALFEIQKAHQDLFSSQQRARKKAKKCSEKCSLVISSFSRHSLRTMKKHTDGLLWVSGSYTEHTAICHLAQTQLLFLCHYTGLKMNSIKAVKVGVRAWKSPRYEHLYIDFSIVKAVWCIYIFMYMWSSW